MRNARLPVVAAIVSALAVGGVGVAAEGGPSGIEKAHEAAAKRGPRGKIGPRGKQGVPGPRGPQGAEGPGGAAGAAGKDGAQGGLSDVVTTNPPVFNLTTAGDVVSLNLPAGQWLVTAHLGGAHNDPTNFARLECTLSEPGGSGADFSKLRLPPNNGDGTTALVFFDNTLHTPVNLAAATTVKVTCAIIGASTGFTFTTRKMTAVRTGTITTQ